MFLGSYQGRGIIHLSEQPERIKTHRKSRNSKQMSVFTRTLIKMIVFPSKTMFYDNVDRFALIFFSKNFEFIFAQVYPERWRSLALCFCYCYCYCCSYITHHSFQKFLNIFCIISFRSLIYFTLKDVCRESAASFQNSRKYLKQSFLLFSRKAKYSSLTDWLAKCDKSNKSSY